MSEAMCESTGNTARNLELESGCNECSVLCPLLFILVFDALSCESILEFII